MVLRLKMMMWRRCNGDDDDDIDNIDMRQCVSCVSALYMRALNTGPEGGSASLYQQ